MLSAPIRVVSVCPSSTAASPRTSVHRSCSDIPPAAGAASGAVAPAAGAGRVTGVAVAAVPSIQWVSRWKA